LFEVIFVKKLLGSKTNDRKAEYRRIFQYID